MKKILILLAVLFLCAQISAQGIMNKIDISTAKLDSKTDKSEKDRYKNVSFSFPNADGQLLHYAILPEGNNTVALVKKDGKENRYNDSHYTIPSTVSYNGTNYTVTEIGKEAFCQCKVTSVSLPPTLKRIASVAFLGASIAKIDMNEGIETIGIRAFQFSQLTSVTIPKSVKIIKRYAFSTIKPLISVTFNEGLEEIENGAFYQTSLTSIIIPSSVKRVGDFAFGLTYNSVQELSIPNNLHSIGKNAFCIFGNGWKSITYYYSGMISNLPTWITPANCKDYGIGKDACDAYQSIHLAKQQQPQVIYIQGNPNNTVSANVPNIPTQNVPAQEKQKVLSSDVDTNIPTNPVNNENTFAIIIANENYQEESHVDYALNDGRMFRTYCNKVLGLPEKNIHLREDATLNNILFEIEWLSKVAQAYEGTANLIVYYAGHGIPDEASGSAYLLPVDGKGSMLTTGYSLARLYKTLGELPAKSITLFMDACFSGSQRNGKMLTSARGIAIKTKPEAPKGKMVVFSAAQEDETAYPYSNKEHGLFTYYLLKKLQETKGEVTYNELGEYIKQKVSRKSIVENGKSQTPVITPSANWGNGWQNMKFKQ